MGRPVLREVGTTGTRSWGRRTVPPALPRVIPWWVRWTANGNAADWVDPEMSLKAGDLAAQP